MLLLLLLLLPLLGEAEAEPGEVDGACALSGPVSGAMHSSPGSSSDVASVVLDTLDEIES